MRKILSSMGFAGMFLVIVSIVPSRVFATEASLRCTPTSGTYAVGATFTVDYILDTRSFESLGADIVAFYDSSVLDVVGTASTPVTSTTGWGQPTTNTIDKTNGKITLSYGSSQAAFTGNTAIGQVTFRTKAAGQGQFNYNFFQQYDDTTAGVAKVYGKRDGTTVSNILTDVNNCIYVIEDATVTSAPTPTTPPGQPTSTPPPISIPSATPVVLPPPKASQLPRAGVLDATVSFLGLGGIFLGLSAGTMFYVHKKHGQRQEEAR